MAATIYLERLAGKRRDAGVPGARSPPGRGRRASEFGWGSGGGEADQERKASPVTRARPLPNSQWVNPAAQQAELVALRVGEHVPADLALADVGRRGAEIEQPAQLGVLLAVGGVEIQVQPVLGALRLGSLGEVDAERCRRRRN